MALTCVPRPSFGRPLPRAVDSISLYGLQSTARQICFADSNPRTTTADRSPWDYSAHQLPPYNGRSLAHPMPKCLHVGIISRSSSLYSALCWFCIDMNGVRRL